MIVSVGGTPPPIIKSIIEYQPEFISFFASQDTCDMIAQIKEETSKKGVSFSSEITLVDNADDLLLCFEKAEEAVKRVIAKQYKTEDVIVDFTGGTKNMSVALTLAAITHGFSFSYVGGKERTKDGVGTVVNGSEVVYQSINPWDFLAIEEKRKIVLLFNSYQFKAAKDLTDGLLEKSIKYKSMFKKLGFLIDGYHKWDLFRYHEAKELFKRAKIEELLETDDASIRAFAKASNHMLNYLEKIVTCGKKPNLVFILDMYSNAERRFEEGKIDDAILRLYRLVEMSAQERLLNKYGIDASDVDKEKIPDKLKDEFVKNYRSQRDGKIKISQATAFKLLNELNDPLGKSYKDNESRFLDIQSSRNYSYLAHGFESLKEKTYLTLREFILSLGILKVDDIAIFPKLDL